MKTWQRRLLILIGNLFLSEMGFSEPYPYHYRSGYYLGRGDTGIATADFEEAIFYNPAGIANGSGIFKRIVFENLQIEISKNTRDVIKQISLQDQSPTDTLRRQVGNPQHIGSNFFTGIILRKAAIGAFASSDSTVLLAKDPTKGAFESITASSVNEGGLTFTLAESFFSKSLYLGTTVKYLQRLQGYFFANATESDSVKDLSNPDELAMLGSGASVDIGLMYKQFNRTPLSFGITVQDVGGTTMIPNEPTDLEKSLRPLKDPVQTVNMGIAIEPGTRLSKFKLMADYRDILNATKQSKFKKIHLGSELSVSNFIGFTAGLNQGYPTFGTYFNIRLMRFDLGAYTEEFGIRAGSRPDSRYFFAFTTGF